MLKRSHLRTARRGGLAVAAVVLLGAKTCLAASVETVVVDPAELVQSGAEKKRDRTIADVVAFDRKRRSDRLLFVRLDNPAAIDQVDVRGLTTQQRSEKIARSLTDLAVGRPIPEKPQPVRITDWITAMEAAARRVDGRAGLDVLVVASDFRFEYDGAWETMDQTVPSLACLGGANQPTRLRRGRLPADLKIELEPSATVAARLSPAAAAVLILALDGDGAARPEKRRVSGIDAPSCPEATQLDLGAFHSGLTKVTSCQAIPTADVLPSGTPACSGGGNSQDKSRLKGQNQTQTQTQTPSPPVPPAPAPPVPPAPAPAPAPPAPPAPVPPPPPPPPPPVPPAPAPSPPAPSPPAPPPPPPPPPPAPPPPVPAPPPPPPPPEGTLGGWTLDRVAQTMSRRADYGFRLEASASQAAVIGLSAVVAPTCAGRTGSPRAFGPSSIRETPVGMAVGRSDFATGLDRGCHLALLRLNPPAEGCWSEPAVVSGTLSIEAPGGERRVVAFRRAIALCAGDPVHFDVLTGIDVP